MAESSTEIDPAEPAAFQVESAQPQEREPQEPIPELPETIVPSRLGGFPAEPLGEGEVVSPSRIPTPAEQSASSVTVITQQQIERTGQTSVAEVLRGTLGLDVVRQGGPGGITSVFLRGANSQHTKVLLDGMPLNDPSNATRGFDFSTMNVDNIERIEILRGPQSMVYGSDAIGGVVNIITKRGEGPLSVRAVGMGGSFNTGQTGVSASGGDERRYYSLSGSFFSTGGISAASRPPFNTEHDAFNVGTASGRVGYNVGEEWNVDYVFRYTDAVAEIDDFDLFKAVPFDNLIRKNLTRSFANRVQLSNWMIDGLVQQRVGFHLIDYDRRDTVSGFFAPDRFRGQTREVDYQVSAQLLETNVLSAGANYLHEEAESFDPVFPNPLARQNIAGVYVQDAFQIGPNWFNTAGARWDDTSSAGRAETYRVTSLYQIEPTGTALHGSLGTGFRQPALAENLFAFGNPNLRPERSKGWDVGVRQNLWEDVLSADATYFRNDFTDLIVFDFDTFSLQNVGQARSSGVELSLLCFLTEQLTVNASYTFDDTLNFDTGALLLRRPRNKATVALTRDSLDGRTSVTLSMLVVGDRLDTRSTVLDDFILLNLAATRRASDRLEFFARLDNLTNQFYEEVLGFGTPGFGAYGGLGLTW